jgi:hypothetical protein
MDRAAIFAETTRRNALRRASGLPLLNIRVEFEHQVALAELQQYRAACDLYAEEKATIRQQVLAEFREKHGADFGHSMGGRWAVGEATRKRFDAAMAVKLGAAPESPAGARNKIVYGDSRNTT